MTTQECSQECSNKQTPETQEPQECKSKREVCFAPNQTIVPDIPCTSTTGGIDLDSSFQLIKQLFNTLGNSNTEEKKEKKDKRRKTRKETRKKKKEDDEDEDEEEDDCDCHECDEEGESEDDSDSSSDSESSSEDDTDSDTSSSSSESTRIPDYKWAAFHQLLDSHNALCVAFAHLMEDSKRS